MPKLSKNLPKYRRHKRSGQAVVTLAGRDHYLGPYGTKASRSEYDRVLAEWIATGRPDAAEPHVGDATVNELLAAYLRFAKGYFTRDGKLTSEFACIRYAMKPLKELYGRTFVKDFGPLALKAVRQKMIDAGWVRTSVNHQVGRVRRIFKWGVENELVPSSVLHGLQAVAGLQYGRTEAKESEPVKPVPKAFVDAVLPHVARPVAAMIELQRLTGMRSGEAVVMRGCDIDATGSVWIYRPATHKNRWRGHERCVYLGPQAQAIVKAFLKPSIEAFLFSPADAVAEMYAERNRQRTTPVGYGNRPGTNRKAKPVRSAGERYTPDTYRRAIERGCKTANVPTWFPHQLRHHHATVVRREFGIQCAQVMLGHKSIDVTELYAEVDREKGIEIAAKIG